MGCLLPVPALWFGNNINAILRTLWLLKGASNEIRRQQTRIILSSQLLYSKGIKSAVFELSFVKK